MHIGCIQYSKCPSFNFLFVLVYIPLTVDKTMWKVIFFFLYLKFLLGWRCVLDPTKQNSLVCAKMRDKRLHLWHGGGGFPWVSGDASKSASAFPTILRKVLSNVFSINLSSHSCCVNVPSPNLSRCEELKYRRQMSRVLLAGSELVTQYQDQGIKLP